MVNEILNISFEITSKCSFSLPTVVVVVGVVVEVVVVGSEKKLRTVE